LKILKTGRDIKKIRSANWPVGAYMPYKYNPLLSIMHEGHCSLGCGDGMCIFGTILMLGGGNKINNPKWDIHLDTENKSYNNKNLMAQWLRVLLVLYHMIRNEEVKGLMLIGVNCFFFSYGSFFM